MHVILIFPSKMVIQCKQMWLLSNTLQILEFPLGAFLQIRFYCQYRHGFFYFSGVRDKGKQKVIVNTKSHRV